MCAGTKIDLREDKEALQALAENGHSPMKREQVNFQDDVDDDKDFGIDEDISNDKDKSLLEQHQQRLLKEAEAEYDGVDTDNSARKKSKKSSNK